MANRLHLKNQATGKSEVIEQHFLAKTDWGFNFFVDTELEAYKAAYLYRNNPHGVKVEYANGVGQWLVTVFNEDGAAAKLDGSR